MNGFIVILSTVKNRPVNIPVFWKESFDFQSSNILQKSIGDNFQIERFSSSKFVNEKFWIETNDYLFVNEGIIQNKRDLCKQNNVKDFKNLINKYYDNNNNTFFSEFEGNFSGFFFNKYKNAWIVFNNKTGIKKVFYFYGDDYLIFASDLKTLTESLKTLRISYSLNEEGAYLLLSSGFMHENLTLINEIKQLRAGEYCCYSSEKLKVESYFNLKKICETNDSKKIIIEQLDSLFKAAIRLEFQIDKNNNYKHLTTLSGGLDSRMTALMAYKMGYQDQMLFNFSELGYADEIIAKQIAKTYELKLIQIELDALSMVSIDDVVKVNDGLTLYSGCSHAFNAIAKINNTENVLIHTGMIGDAVMGSFVSQINTSKPKIEDGHYSQSLLKRVEGFLNNSIQNYPSEELYKFYNRAFLGANNGFLYFDLIGESFSPFLNSNFLSYAYSIPRQYKYKENIYIDWIKTLHPDIANFTWENIGGKPTNNEYLRFYYLYKRAFVKRLPIKTMWKNNMNPEQLWYDNNKNIQITLDFYFAEHIELLNDFKELQGDAIELYKTGNITEKTQVLTLLSAFKLLFK
ncbi:MAG: hypothetical protein WC542_08625 [Paludibacter sp.]